MIRISERTTVIHTFFFVVVLMMINSGCQSQNDNGRSVESINQSAEQINNTDQQWKAKLTPEQYHVTREQGTERAFTGAYWDHKEKGMYNCVCCNRPLFSSESKFRSGTGWPSFYQPVNEINVRERPDSNFGMVITEVICNNCEAHLGHVFSDGPQPTGLRYCINSASLNFEPVKP